MSTITDLLQSLKPKERRGSKPRCHLLTYGSPEQVSAKLTQLINPWGKVASYDRWMPQGFARTEEAQFGRVDSLLDPAIGDCLINWWLAIPKAGRVPHWDIASTCTIERKSGLLLVEAKAHDQELIREKAGKKREKIESTDSLRNRAQIDSCMNHVNISLSAETKLSWFLSIEHYYQMSNRFAWAWKLSELGIPVILVYLGFLNAEEMRDQGVPFAEHISWEKLVKSQSITLFPENVWNNRWLIHGQPFIPLIRSYEQPLLAFMKSYA